MLIGIRVDASLNMGTGHTYRMLTLAKQLKKNGHNVFFISRCLKGNLIDLVKESFDVLELPAPDSHLVQELYCDHTPWLEVEYNLEIQQTQSVIAKYLTDSHNVMLDWLIIDHYAIEKKWQTALKPFTRSYLQIDDLADREHDVDVLLDQNYYQLGQSRYDNLLPNKTKRLCGPEFSLLRDEFAIARQKLAPFEVRLQKGNVVLFFGGIDMANETSKALKALLMVKSDDQFDVIIGINNPHREEVEALCDRYSDRVSLHIQVSNMMDFFAESYLYVGAVGATTWERCVMSLPGIVCSVADNQTQLALDLSLINGHDYLGINTSLTELDYATAYKKLLSNPEHLLSQSEACGRLIDGSGCQKVVSELEEISKYDKI